MTDLFIVQCYDNGPQERPIHLTESCSKRRAATRFARELANERHFGLELIVRQADGREFWIALQNDEG